MTRAVLEVKMVDPLFSKLDLTTPTVYEREQGVICYKLCFLHRFIPRDPASGKNIVETETARALLGSGIVWWWQSAAIGSSGGPPRAWTRLGSETLFELAKDIADSDPVDEFDARFIGLIGFDPVVCAADFPENLDDIVADTCGVDAGSVREALAVFARNEAGPICIAIVNAGDDPFDRVFVPHYPTERVRQLLRTLGVVDGAPMKRRRYSRLNVARLESVYELDDR